MGCFVNGRGSIIQLRKAQSGISCDDFWAQHGSELAIFLAQHLLKTRVFASSNSFHYAITINQFTLMSCNKQQLITEYEIIFLGHDQHEIRDVPVFRLPSGRAMYFFGKSFLA